MKTKRSQVPPPTWAPLKKISSLSDETQTRMKTNEWFFLRMFFLPRWRFRNFGPVPKKKISGPNIFRKWRTEPSFEILQFQRIFEELKPFVFELFLHTLKWHCLDSVTTLCRGIIRTHVSGVAPDSEGTSTDWATAPRLPYRTLFNHGPVAIGHLIEISTYRKVPQKADRIETDLKHYLKWPTNLLEALFGL